MREPIDTTAICLPMFGVPVPDPRNARIAELEREVDRLRADRDQIAETLLAVQQSHARLEKALRLVDEWDREYAMMSLRIMEAVRAALNPDADQPHTAFEVGL